VRINYCFLESRTDEYLNKVETHQTLYDIAGERRDIFATLNVGICKFIEVEREKEDKTKPHKPSKQKYHPPRYPWLKKRTPKK